MSERIERLRREPKRSRNTPLRSAYGLKLRRYELARKWRLGRALLPFSRLALCLLRRPRPLLKVDAAPIRVYKQLKVHNSLRRLALRYDFRFTILLSRLERNSEVPYVPASPTALRQPAMREVSTATHASLPLHVTAGSSRTSRAVTSSQRSITGARHRTNVHVQHTFSHGSGRGSQAGVFARMSLKPLEAVHSRSLVISQSRIILQSLSQIHQPNQPGWINWSTTGSVATTLPGTTTRLRKHSAAATPALPQEATAAHFLREVKTFSVSHQHSAARKILHDTMPPPSISAASVYRPINIELVKRQASDHSKSAPAIDSLERTMVASYRSRPEVASRWETEEKVINEKIHRQVEHSVREQVERTFRTDRVLVQRLSREIQSDLYRGIVFERERLGLR